MRRSLVNHWSKEKLLEEVKKYSDREIADGSIVEQAIEKVKRLQRQSTAASMTTISEDDKKKIENGEIITIDEFEAENENEVEDDMEENK